LDKAIILLHLDSVFWSEFWLQFNSAQSPYVVVKDFFADILILPFI